MERPRYRFTIQMVMVLVAVLAVALALPAALGSRRARFEALAAHHRRRMIESANEAARCMMLAHENAARARTARLQLDFARGAAATPGDAVEVEGVPIDWWAIAQGHESDLGEFEREEARYAAQVQRFQRIVYYHRSLLWKYQRASRHPWQAVELDPPGPR